MIVIVKLIHLALTSTGTAVALDIKCNKSFQLQPGGKVMKITNSTRGVRVFRAFVQATLAVFLISTMVVLSSHASEQPFRPTLVPQKPTHLFTPSGFDNNDASVQVVIAGEFANTCYKVGPVEAEVDESNHRIVVHNRAYLYESCWCAQVMVPYEQVVDLGQVAAGRYEVLIDDENGKPEKMGALNISVSTNQGPDDYLYVPVEQINVTTHENAAPVLEIKGTFTSDCMTFDQVKVAYREGNVIEVLPIAKYIESDQQCRKVLTPFTREVTLDGAPKGKTLIHVRSLNGRAINKVMDF